MTTADIGANVLVADIGATNARFSWADGNGLSGECIGLRSADYTASEALVEEALARLAERTPAAAGFAMAGAVDAGRGRMTNRPLSFDAAALAERLGCPVTVVNDFQAVARGLPELEQLMQIGGDAPVAGMKAVLGPGSGLGMGLLAPLDGGWHVLASEGGHADLAPGSPLETEILSVLQAAHGHVDWETVLSGPGLVRLYGAVCRIWGAEPEEITPEQITSRGVAIDDPVCHQTLESFFALLGGAAGSLALTVYARGGVYLGGGIVPKLADFARESPLRRRFDERGPMTELAQRIPLYLILDEQPGLIGALAGVRDMMSATDSSG
jgi:glucokinase